MFICAGHRQPLRKQGEPGLTIWWALVCYTLGIHSQTWEFSPQQLTAALGLFAARYRGT